MLYGKEAYHTINALLNQKLNKEEVLIAVHRGSSGANIIENTIPAYKAAIQQGGDIVEVDVIKSTDGVLYTFHDGEEKRLLNETDNIKTMDSATIDSLSYINGIGHKINYKVERLEAVLTALKGEVLINLDRAWGIWSDVLPVLDKYAMSNQIILKSPVVKESLEFLDSYDNKYMYMPIIHSLADIDHVLMYQNINIVGMELVADRETHALFQDELILNIKKKHLYVWANAVKLDDKKYLFAKIDDNTSIIQNPDLGWGKMIEKKVDIIQTDWPAILANYRKARSKKV